MQAVRLGQLLIEAKVLQQPQLDAALAEQRRSGGKLGEVLVRLKFISEQQLTATLAMQQGVEEVELDRLAHIDPAALSRLSASAAHELQALPLGFVEGGRLLQVAIADVPRGARLEALRLQTRAWVVPRLASRGALQRALLHFYGTPPEPVEAPTLSTSTELRVLVELLAERGVLSWDEYLSRLRRAPVPPAQPTKESSP